MNPAQLLNPRAFARSNGGTSHSNKRVTNSQDYDNTLDSPHLDKTMLINSRTSVKRSLKEGESDDRDRSTPNNQENIPFRGVQNMIERIHDVENRQDPPQKRLKRDLEDINGNQAFGGSSSGSVIGQYIKEKDQDKNDSRDSIPAIVDLTQGDDDDGDDDLILVSDSGDMEVCLGKIESAFVNAYQVPATKFSGSQSQWPQIMVTLTRLPGGNHAITALDYRGKDFGRLDFKTSVALSPLMDGRATNKLRLEARLEQRKKSRDDVPGMPISQKFSILINLYAPKKYADGIGKFLSQKQVWLRHPVFKAKNIEYVNPQTPRTPNIPNNKVASSSRGAASAASYVTRTVEEIRSDVMNMFDSLTKTEDLEEKEQDFRILTPLLKHQKQALHFMSEREKDHDISDGSQGKGSLWRTRVRQNGRKAFYNVISGIESFTKPSPILGGILADMMGLGKTLSILSLIVDTLDESRGWARNSDHEQSSILNSEATLLVAPVSTVSNWEDQIRTHIKPGTLRTYVYHGPGRCQDTQELAKNNVVITTYNTIAADFSSQRKRPLQKIRWFRIVLDEAHMIRQQSTRQSQAVCSLYAQRRWAVTGTPVQNRLDDLGALIKFLRIKPFDEKGGFTQFILAPFKSADPEILPKLRLLVDSITLRRLKDRIDLPQRRDHLVKLGFSADERTLYDWFAKDSANKVNAVTMRDKNGLGGRAYAHILRAILRLRLICAHGQELLSDEDMKIAQGISYGNAIDLGDDEEDDRPVLTSKQAYDMLHLLQESDMDRCSLCNRKLGLKEFEEGTEGKLENVIGYMTPCYQVVCTACIDNFRDQIQERATSDNYMTCPLCEQYVRISLYELRNDELEADESARNRIRSNPKLAKQLGRYNGPHTKTKALLESLLEDSHWNSTHLEEPPIKSVIFSGWTSHLDLIQLALEAAGLLYTRLDGRMSRPARSSALESFINDKKITIILVSIAAGGLGLNLTVASKAYVMEPQFNPAAEAQAVDRIHRLGQKREVTITRFVMQDSFEEKMLELQRKKMDLADLTVNNRMKVDKTEAAKRRLEELRSLFR